MLLGRVRDRGCDAGVSGAPAGRAIRRGQAAAPSRRRPRPQIRPNTVELTAGRAAGAGSAAGNAPVGDCSPRRIIDCWSESTSKSSGRTPPSSNMLWARIPISTDNFAAAGFDAVIIVGAPPTAAAIDFAAAQAAKPEFAPIILLLLRRYAGVAAARDARRNAALRPQDRSQTSCIKNDRRPPRTSIARPSAMLRANPDYENRYRFGTVIIRGHRCIRQVGSGGMCKIYLAESERAGTLVVLKVFSQVPDVSERFVSFDRFLQEYEIVAGLNHKNIVRIYDLGVADDHAYIAMEHFPAGDLRQRMKEPLTPAMAVDFCGRSPARWMPSIRWACCIGI